MFTVHVLQQAPRFIFRHSSIARISVKRSAFSASTIIPSWLNPYVKLARYDKPIGTWLLYLPCTWSIALASSPGVLPDAGMLVTFGAGALIMRGAGCTINDLLDRKFDQQVERTKTRPLASNEITIRNAITFLAIQLSAAFGILLQLNANCIALGVVSMVPVLTYPLFKRFTYWPQFVLGLAFNWGALLGYTAITGHIDLSLCMPLYLAGINWTLIYDTIYAFQDIKDDQRVGVKSLAILLGDNAKLYFSFFQLLMSANLLLVGLSMDAGWFYYSGTALTMAHLARLIYKTNLHCPHSCASAFKASRNTGLIYFFTIVLEKLLSATSS